MFSVEKMRTIGLKKGGHQNKEGAIAQPLCSPVCALDICTEATKDGERKREREWQQNEEHDISSAYSI